MLLIISIVMAVLALLGIGWIVVSGSVTTVDGLFMSLILFAISGIFAANFWWEYRHGGARSLGGGHRARAGQLLPLSASDGRSILQGTILEV